MVDPGLDLGGLGGCAFLVCMEDREGFIVGRSVK